MKVDTTKLPKTLREYTHTHTHTGNLEGKNRIIYFDILNILACICVVFLHMNGIVHSYTETKAWKTALIFEVVCFWAVPIFIMLSGATLLTYRDKYDTKKFFKKRFAKILVPWLVWSLVIYIINNRNLNIIQFVKDFVYCRIEYIYWFFPMILYLYCLIPIISLIKDNKKILWGIVVFIFIFSGVINPVCTILNLEFPAIFIYCLNTNAYIMFLLLGYLLANTDLTKKTRVIMYILGILSMIFRYFYTYYFSMKKGVLNRDLFDYCTFVSAFLAISVFIFIKNIKWENILSKIHIKPQRIAKIASCSFGVYLIHIILKNELTKFFNLNVYSIVYRTIGAGILYVLCVVIVLILKKIPILNKIVP